jgi:hypothetical protein
VLILPVPVSIVKVPTDPRVVVLSMYGILPGKFGMVVPAPVPVTEDQSNPGPLYIRYVFAVVGAGMALTVAGDVIPSILFKVI